MSMVSTIPSNIKYYNSRCSKEIYKILLIISDDTELIAFIKTFKDELSEKNVL